MDLRLDGVPFPVQWIPSRDVALEGLTSFFCDDCDEERDVDDDNMICSICGAFLTRKMNPVTAPASLNHEEEHIREQQHWDTLVDFLGEDIRSLVESAYSMRAPDRVVSESFLKSLSQCDVDENYCILQDCCLRLDPRFEAVIVPAAFASQKIVNFDMKFDLVFGIPACGEHEFENLEFIKGRILVLTRGRISFAEKYRRAVNAGALALIIVQTLDVFPFVMTDTVGELAVTERTLPCYMMSKSDGILLQRLYDKTTTNLQLIHRERINECAICCEEFKVGDRSLKLLCRHAYHADCVLGWLKTKSSCPLCRVNLNPGDGLHDNRREGSPRHSNGHQAYTV